MGPPQRHFETYKNLKFVFDQIKPNLFPKNHKNFQFSIIPILTKFDKTNPYFDKREMKLIQVCSFGALAYTGDFRKFSEIF